MTRRTTPQQKRDTKRLAWVERVRTITGLDADTLTSLLLREKSQSIRLNTLKAESDVLAPYNLQSVAWSGGVGYRTDSVVIDTLKASELAETGAVYIQNAASWLPVVALDPQPSDAILDVCAAPGGKASHIQAMTHNQSTLTCNDNSKPRLLKLQRNMERLGAKADFTLCDATRLSRKFEPETFDKILLDAPCSGEGLMTLRPEDTKLFDSWSVAHIRRLSDLQRKILHESWQLLETGGTLVYSTCTMAPEENEAVIDYFLRKHPDARLEPLDFPLKNRIPALTSWNNKPFANDLSPCLRLIPSKLTEAFFVAKIVKK